MAGISRFKPDNIQVEIADHIHRVVKLRAVDDRASCSLITRFLRKLADYGNFAAFLQRQDIAFVLQQNNALLAGFLCKSMMLFHIEFTAFHLVHGSSGSQHNIQQFIHTDINLCLGDSAFLNSLHQLARAVAAGRRHLQMGTCPHAFRKVIAGTPVGNDKSVKTPVIPQDFLQEMCVFIGIDTVDHIVGRHDGFRMPFFDGNFKICQVDFTQGTLIHHRVGCHSAQLCIVRGKMLRAGRNTMALDAADITCCHLTRQIRILRKILEVPPAERASLDVEPRPQKHAHILAGCLIAEMLPEFLAEFGIPGVCHRGCRRITGGGNRAVQPELIACAFLFADAVRAVGQCHVLNAEAPDTLRLPEVTAGEKMAFLFQSHLFDQIFMFQCFSSRSSEYCLLYNKKILSEKHKKVNPLFAVVPQKKRVKPVRS